MNSIIIFFANFGIGFFILAVILAWWELPTKKRWHYAVSIILACIFAYAISRIAASLFYDPRPFVTEHVKPLINHAPDNGFPSDHALLTMTLTAITYFYHKKFAASMLVFSIFIGVARVLAKVHSPIDILAAWAIGILSAIAAYYLTLWLFARYEKKRYETKKSAK